MRTVEQIEYDQVKAGFVSKGTTLSQWCRERGLQLANVRAAFMGTWVGPRAAEIKRQAREAAAVEPTGW